MALVPKSDSDRQSANDDERVLHELMSLEAKLKLFIATAVVVFLDKTLLECLGVP